MTASETRAATLKQLRAARKRMTSLEWTLKLEQESQAVKQSAAVEQIRVNHAILKLVNTQLAEIRDALVANEADLEIGRARLQQAVDSLANVKATLVAVKAFLGVVRRVVTLLL